MLCSWEDYHLWSFIFVFHSFLYGPPSNLASIQPFNKATVSPGIMKEIYCDPGWHPQWQLCCLRFVRLLLLFLLFSLSWFDLTVPTSSPLTICSIPSTNFALKIQGDVNQAYCRFGTYHIAFSDSNTSGGTEWCSHYSTRQSNSHLLQVIPLVFQRVRNTKSI